MTEANCPLCGNFLFSRACLPNTIICESCGYMQFIDQSALKAQGPYTPNGDNYVPRI